MTCYGRYGGRNWVQEYYETASRDAGKRARELRKMGYRVVTECAGEQVTRVGRVKLTMLTVDGRDVPYPDKIEEI